jgi:Nitrogenase molybdenum-iron protein, alpha and beta chains
MKRPIYQYIPPIACDFSGASSVLFSFPSLNIFYCPASCTQPIAECDEIRNLQDSLVYHSIFGEVAAVMGSDKEFLEEAEILSRRHDEVEFITIISTPVPAIVGSDLSYMAAQLREKIQKPVLVVDTTGFESYYSGVQQTLAEMAKQFLEKREKNPSQVNLVGYTPLSLGYESQFDEFVEALEKKGLTVHGLPRTMTCIEDFKKLAEGSLNVVLSHEGVALAQTMEKNLEIPYLLGMPVGHSKMAQMIQEIMVALGREANLVSEVAEKTDHSYKRAVVVGEPLVAASVAQALREDFSFPEAVAVSAYEQERKLKKSYKEEALQEVRYCSSEEELVVFLNEYQPDIIFGDPFYQKFIDSKFTYVPMSHVGLSGRVHQKYITSLVGNLGHKWLREALSK